MDDANVDGANSNVPRAESLLSPLAMPPLPAPAPAAPQPVMAIQYASALQGERRRSRLSLAMFILCAFSELACAGLLLGRALFGPGGPYLQPVMYGLALVAFVAWTVGFTVSLVLVLDPREKRLLPAASLISTGVLMAIMGLLAAGAAYF